MQAVLVPGKWVMLCHFAIGHVTLRGLALVLCLALLSPPTEAATVGRRITEQEVLQFARVVVGNAQLSDTALRALLQENYEGVPFLDWVALILAGSEAHTLLTAGQRTEAARLAFNTYVDFGLGTVASALGLSGVAAVAQLALLPVRSAIDTLVRTMNEDGMRAQVDCYFLARQLRETYDSIINRISLSQEVSFDDGGWLIEVMATPCRRGLARHPNLLGARETMAVAEWLWSIGSNRPEFVRQGNVIMSALRATAMTLVAVEGRLTAVRFVESGRVFGILSVDHVIQDGRVLSPGNLWTVMEGRPATDRIRSHILNTVRNFVLHERRGLGVVGRYRVTSVGLCPATDYPDACSPDDNPRMLAGLVPCNVGIASV